MEMVNMGSPVHYRYVLITAARNEEAFIEKTIRSVINQTILPLKWVIVSDGSIDRTDRIVEGYLNNHKFIHLLKQHGDDRRNFGSQVRAINAGYEKIRDLDYDFIGNLDADVSFREDYYQRVLERLAADSRLGLTGGYIFEERNGAFMPRRFNRTTSVAHAVQLFKRNCYEDVGGYVPLKYGGPDWYAEVTARLKGWNVKSFPDLPVYHHKPTLTAEGKLKGGFRQGRMDYSFGSSPFFEIFRCLRRVRKPYGLLYSLCRFGGFLWGYLVLEKRPVSKDFIKYLRKEQRRKLFNAALHPFHSMAI
jgi:glycosyltransferase involved in cell wall biosynthesis